MFTVPADSSVTANAGAARFGACIDGMLERYGRQSRFILRVSDMVRADAEWDRLMYLAERVGSLPPQ